MKRIFKTLLIFFIPGILIAGTQLLGNYIPFFNLISFILFALCILGILGILIGLFVTRVLKLKK